ARRAHELALDVDRQHLVVEAQRNARGGEELLPREVQVGCRSSGEEARELHPVVGRARLLAEDGDVELAARGELLEEALADHAVADDADPHAALLPRRATGASRPTSPTTTIAGPSTPAGESVPSVATTCRWLRSEPFSMRQAGVCGLMPADFSAAA